MARRKVARKRAARPRGGTRVPADLRDSRSAAALLRESLNAIANLDTIAAFPGGIERIEIDIGLREGRVQVRLSGAGAARQAGVPAAIELESLALVGDDLVIGQKVPNKAERDTVGAATHVIKRDTPEFNTLVRNDNPDIVFKDEDLPVVGADHMMTTKLRQKVDKLAQLVKAEWPASKLRVVEAWDENNEHGTNSVHYEARAVDITTAPVDGAKLGRLGRLAVNAGFDWVFFENALHVHASVSA